MKALITGASGGIGSAVAELLRQNGYEILTLSSRFEDADALAKECRALAAVQGIDALILCAGTAKFAPLEAMSENEILKILNLARGRFAARAFCKISSPLAMPAPHDL